MDKFSVVNGQLTLGATTIGPSTALYAAPGELKSLGVVDGVVHTTMTRRIDLVFAAGNDRVVGVELKRGQDLVTSHDTRRLARQLGTIGQLCDVVVLGVSDGLPRETVQDWVSYQMMGVVIVPMRTTDRGQAELFASLRPILGGTRTILASFAWTDIDLKPKHDKPGWLLHDIPFIGDKLVGKLLDRFGSTGVALAATDEEWRSVGASQRVIDARREALK